MILQIVRFKPGLAEAKVLELYRERASRYRAVKGLRQMYYLRFPVSGEYGAVYIWESEAALREFRSTDLGRTISNAYLVQGARNSELADIMLLLRPEQPDVRDEQEHGRTDAS
ncbi:MAG: antibiotic biosynthesis monooxygenase family protein [Anaerolineae bacterium]